MEKNGTWGCGVQECLGLIVFSCVLGRPVIRIFASRVFFCGAVRSFYTDSFLKSSLAVKGLKITIHYSLFLSSLE